jgi:tetratricopeptide (TPR) repeat protein
MVRIKINVRGESMLMRNFNFLMAVALLLAAPFASAQFTKGDPAPCIAATDINETTVDSCENIAAKNPYLALYFFFEPQSGQDIALKLRLLDMRYGSEKMDIVALGFEEDAEALRAFAQQLDLRYHIISRDSVAGEWVQEIKTLPIVLFIRPDEKPIIENVLRGGGETSATLLKEVAENLYNQRKAEALEVTEIALEEGEPEADVRELKGHILVVEGKLDAAATEFTAIDDPAGLARIALERGNYDEAVSIADGAPTDAYAQTVKGQALLNQGKVDDAGAVLDAAAEMPADEWQQSEAVTAAGRVDQARGDNAAATSQYERAIALDPYNVIALSNQSTVLQDAGKVEEAKAVLETAVERRGDDELVQLMLAQIDQRSDNDRLSRIQQQIKDLAAWAEKMEGQVTDSWTTRPLVVSFLSGNQSEVFFPRAGTESAVRFAIAQELRERANVTVVDRENIDLVLQEQQLSMLGDPATAIQPGRLKIARYLSFVDFDQLDGDPSIFLRVTDTETGEVVLSYQENMPPGKVAGPVSSIVSRLMSFYADQEIRGLVAAVLDDNSLLLNIARPHGVTAGAEFTVVQEGEPITAGGRVVAHRQLPVAKISVTGFDAETGLATAEVKNVREGVAIEPEMKFRTTD